MQTAQETKQKCTEVHQALDSVHANDTLKGRPRVLRSVKPLPYVL